MKLTALDLAILAETLSLSLCFDNWRGGYSKEAREKTLSNLLKAMEELC